MKLTINGNDVEVDASDDSPLLWVLRDNSGVVDTKYGCGIVEAVRKWGETGSGVRNDGAGVGLGLRRQIEGGEPAAREMFA